ncbi:MAG: HAMP domain-containing histidine kinase [Clostridiales Family XIII bacterium]|jgi:signal transduction histidine kinase|nr:HAMP domain-containing histidine kinase [Clostridiales Family XIII bacterium]
MKISIATKMTIFTCALVLATLLGQLAFNAFLSGPLLIEQKKSTVNRLFDTLPRNYSDDPDFIYRLTEKAEGDNIDILIFSDNGLVYSSRNIEIPVIRRRFLFIGPFDRAAFPEDARAKVARRGQGGETLILLNGRFDYGGEARYTIIETPVESIETGVRLLSWANLRISAVVLLLGIACALVFSRRFSKPIREIGAVAQNVANLRFDTRADENLSTVELSELSASINAMAENLKRMIADLKDKNERLQSDIDRQLQLDRMRREFVANVSHEFKTPLCLLQLYSENLKDNIDSADKDFYCDTIIDEVNRLDAMAKSLLDIASLENGLSGMRTEALDFSGFCKGLLARMDPLFDGIELDANLQEGLFVEGDGHYLEQAVRNYLVNAVSHTAAGGRVSVSLRRSGGRAFFSVFNEGKPIAGEDVSRVWESFYKTDRARARAEESHAGLGLYIVKTIVNAHGGTYGLINNADGVVFWFMLPLSEREEEKQEE